MISSFLGQKPFSTAATTAAQAPVPHAHVSPLPRSQTLHFKRMAVDHLGKLRIDTFGKELIVFKHRPDCLNIKHIHIIHKHHAMRIPHRNAGNVILLLPNQNRPVNHSAAVKLHGDLRRRKLGLCPY